MKIYDLIVIGMGPAGMAASAMASALDLEVLAVEENKVGGECLNCGCMPSKALLKTAQVNQISHNLEKFGIRSSIFTDPDESLDIVRQKISRISGKKLMQAFVRVKLIINQGNAEFVDSHSVKVGENIYRAKKIFIATGTAPFIPSIEGLDKVDESLKLTNMNLFIQKSMPKSLTIIGGGAIGCEMAQSFARLGSSVNVVHIDEHLLPFADAQTALVLEERFKKENIKVFNKTPIKRVFQKDNKVFVDTDSHIFESEKILIATGRKPNLEALKLDKIGIKYNKKGIIVDKALRTNIKHIYAIGDCNGISNFSHSAMHQGMIALMNAINPMPFKIHYDKYLIPWSVFTTPEVANVGLTEKEAVEKGLKVIVIKKDYESYGRAIVDGATEGFIKIITNKKGKIFGVTIVGESASEIIHEWILAIQFKLSMFDILMTQHSFPTISMLNKMASEDWMMGKLQESTTLKKIARALFKL
ncbi:Dihydrolipoamide dehydrogenase [Desulfurella amilsii]|uniref:Dihydrolipoamide dehydrogenase n=1 Tax=Desulfurella amilsii TaxID=1562698 RepID=A0A1X4XXP9_9BACT|nr:NAD(P)/FAD-dependent oxidoreductase [Desulfurella amilsii]OSS42307.1 Dihydrolipoamide dehydrogenase [Desulfurella amilsii]